ncbi:MAG: ABC transporter ATP-binding protein [Polyangiaceae bacterium]|nr:ABC transporter ATP-binding protein [Polyangiaceae bacterium]
MDAIVRLRAVTKIHALGQSEVHALRGIDVEVARGEMLSVMGSSGSGKSTMLNIVGTLDRPTSGTYELEGEAVESRTDEELAELRSRKLGFVFQAFHLLPRETALSNVELPMVYAGVGRRERRERAVAALERVGLADRADHLPTQLSGGQQQRVAIARSIVNTPALLLADEPTGALDSETAHQVLGLLRELHHQGLSIVLVTHDPEVAKWGDRVIVFRDGSIVSEERPS